MSEEEKREASPPEEKPSTEDAPTGPSAKAPKPQKPSPAPAKPSARKEEIMVQSQRDGAGNFLAMMALAVALGSLVLTAFFAYAKVGPSSTAKWATEFQKTTTQQIKALTARVVELEATAQELKAKQGSGGAVNTLDLKKALVSLRDVGRQTSGDTRKRVQQVEGALKALINELEAKSQ